MKLIVEVLDSKKHDYKKFDCGQEVMNTFLKRFALKNQKLKIRKTWIFCNEQINQNEKSNVIGYFTLTMQHIDPQFFADEKLPKYLLPITLLARIAVDKNF